MYNLEMEKEKLRKQGITIDEYIKQAKAYYLEMLKDEEIYKELTIE